MTPDQLRENFPQHVGLVDLLDAEGYAPAAIMTEVLAALEREAATRAA